MLFDNPQLLALLVNESRAKDAERSGDIYSRCWIEPKYQNSISSLWNEFAKDVYNQDDIVLSVRNRIVKGVFEKEVNSNTVVLLIPCGLVSYPLSSNKNAEYIEVDMADLINYKLTIAKKYQESGLFPKRNIQYVAADICSHEDRKELLTNVSKKNKKQIFIMEGISYYLSEQDWWGIIDDVLCVCSHGDMIVFDYWPYEERLICVYDRFRRFCNKHMTTQIDSFLFLKKSEILSRLSTGVIHIESVISVENQYINTHSLRENNILNDTCAIVTIK